MWGGSDVSIASKITNIEHYLGVTILAEETVMEPGIYGMNAHGSNIILEGNDTQKMLTLHATNGTQHLININGNGTTTTVSSPWPGLNNTFAFGHVRISFYRNFFTIFSPGMIHETFSYHANFYRLTVDVISANSQNLILGAVHSFQPLTRTLIHTPTQLRNEIIANPNGHFVLGNPLDMNGFAWSPIPSLGSNGVLDGRGFHIYHMHHHFVMNASGGNQVGLIGVNHGTIRNLAMFFAIISSPADNLATTSDVGIITGTNFGTIDNVHIMHSHINVPRMRSAIGGIAGVNVGTISSSGTYYSVLETRGDVGGLAGVNASGGLITHSVARGVHVRHFSYDSSRSAGGLVGHNLHATITRSTVSGTIIENTGHSGANLTPFMGYAVGLLNTNSTFWYNAVSASALWSGTLSGYQLTFFGSFHNGWFGLVGGGISVMRDGGNDDGISIKWLEGCALILD